MFPELANKYSQTTVSANGGDIGFQPAIKLAPEYFNAIKDKTAGAITPPVRTQFGIHIIKVMSIKRFEDVNKPFYKKIVYDQKRDTILQQYFAELKKGSIIKVNEKYLN